MKFKSMWNAKINENNRLEQILTPSKYCANIGWQSKMTFCKFVGSRFWLDFSPILVQSLGSQSRINGCHPGGVQGFSTCKEVDTLLYVKPPKNLINVTVELLFTKQCMLWNVPKHFWGQNQAFWFTNWF